MKNFWGRARKGIRSEEEIFQYQIQSLRRYRKLAAELKAAEEPKVGLKNNDITAPAKPHHPAIGNLLSQITHQSLAEQNNTSSLISTIGTYIMAAFSCYTLHTHENHELNIDY